jgi:hypothetical protein
LAVRDDSTLKKDPPKSLAISKNFRMLNLLMKRSRITRPWMQTCALIAAIGGLAATPARSATPSYGYPQQQEEPGFVGRIGGFFRHIFYGESKDSPVDVPPPPQRSNRRNGGSSSNQRLNLDAPPTAYDNEPRRSRTPEDEPPLPPPQRKDTPKQKQETKPADSKSKPRANETKRNPEPTLEKKPTERPHTTPAQTKPTENPSPFSPPSRPTPPPVPPTLPKEKEQDANKPPMTKPSTNETVAENTKENKTPESPQQSSKPAGEKKEILTATKTGNANRVKSPYAPYTELDVAGLPSGSSALDPTTQRIFRVP